MRGTITDIVPQERRAKRFNVFVDHRYAFSLYADLAATVRIGQTLADADVDSLIGADEQQRAVDAALAFLSYRPRSEQEVRRRLAPSHSPSIVDSVLDKLREWKLINDEDFARYWVEQRQAFRPRGARLLKQELRHKGIQAELASEVSEELANDRDAARRAAAKKAKSLTGLDRRTFRERLSAYLARRGFDWESINAVVRELQADD